MRESWRVISRMRLEIALLAIVGLLAPLAAVAGAPKDAFETANRLYEEGKYRQAAASYEQLIRSNLVSPALLFNLGNACFKSGQIGRAVAAYLHAERFAPRDPDIRANLQFARKQVQGPTLATPLPARWLGRLSLNEWTLLASSAVWLFFLLLALGQWRPALSRPLRSTAIVVAILAVLLCALCGSALYLDRTDRTAVVLTPEAVVHYGPLEESPAAFTARDGAELEIIDEKDDWLRVGDGGRNTGWLRRDEVAVVGG